MTRPLRLARGGEQRGQLLLRRHAEPASRVKQHDEGVEDGAKSAHDAIVAAAKGSTGDLRNGWTIHWDLGRYGTNYGLRAVIASFALGANAPEDAIAPTTRLDW